MINKFFPLIISISLFGCITNNTDKSYEIAVLNTHLNYITINNQYFIDKLKANIERDGNQPREVIIFNDLIKCKRLKDNLLHNGGVIDSDSLMIFRIKIDSIISKYNLNNHTLNFDSKLFDKTNERDSIKTLYKLISMEKFMADLIYNIESKIFINGAYSSINPTFINDNNLDSCSLILLTSETIYKKNYISGGLKLVYEDFKITYGNTIVPFNFSNNSSLITFKFRKVNPGSYNIKGNIKVLDKNKVFLMNEFINHNIYIK